MFPKGTGRKTDRQRKAARYRRLRPTVRQRAHDLDGGRCIWPSCRALVSLASAHEHEVQWRSRGGSAVDLENVATTCPACHRDLHGQVGGLKKKMTGTRTAGFQFFEKREGVWVEVT